MYKRSSRGLKVGEIIGIIIPILIAITLTIFGMIISIFRVLQVGDKKKLLLIILIRFKEMNYF